MNPLTFSPPQFLDENEALTYVGYGIREFADRRLREIFYCDKSAHIPKLERHDAIILCRPSRFGKTTFIHMLHNYYDWSIKEVNFDDVSIFFY